MSAPRTGGNGSGLWPTPEAAAFGAADPEKIAARRARLAEKYGNNGFGLTLGQQVAVDTALWPTPTSLAHATDTANEAGNSAGLVAIRRHALWSTPRASDGEKRGPNMSFGAGGQPLPAQAAQAALWATPTARDHKSPLASAETHARNSRPLSEQVGAALWPTPTAGDGSKLDATQPVIERRLAAGKQVGIAGAVRVFGATPSGSPERTASPGALDPAFVSWLMGYPPEWLSCAPSAMRSSRKSRPK